MTDVTVVLADQEVIISPDTWERLVSASPDEGIIVGGFDHYVGADVYGQEALLAAELAPDGDLLLNAVIYNPHGQKDGQIWQSTWALVYPGGQAQPPKYQVRETDGRIELVHAESGALRVRLVEIAPHRYRCEGIFYAPTGDCLIIPQSGIHLNPREDISALLPPEFAAA